MTVTGEGRAIQGLPAAPGVARGPWAHIRRTPLPTGQLLSDDPAALGEARRHLEAAAASAADELFALGDRISAGGQSQVADILAANAAIALDPELLDGAAALMRTTRIGPVDAILGAAERIAAGLRALDDPLIRARATDVLDVADRIARHVAGLPADEATLLEPAIVVAEDLSPALTATLPRERLLGILLEGGSATAHAAILARAYAIPAVVGAHGALAILAAAGHGVEIAIDGGTGEVAIAPDAAAVAAFDARAATLASARSVDLAEATLPAVTLDGTHVELLANIGTSDEAAGAIELGAAGVGLFRTEFLFLERATPPSEDEQAAAYRAAVDAFDGRPVTIRLLDIGGDKPIPYLPIAPEANPFLGVRALRLAADRPELFVTQLRACYRAAVAGPVKVMAPMVADAADAELLLRLAAEARTGLVAEGTAFGEVDLGVMLEIPSAILTADAYFGGLRFASLGTNDLAQYALAVDRGNAALEGYRDAMHPGVLRLVAMAVASAERAGITLSVCGEMAGDPAAALALVGLGVRQLSMTAPSIPAVRRAIRRFRANELAERAEAALADGSAQAARARFAALLARDA